MSCLDATFTLTPRSPSYYAARGQSGELYCLGADFLPYGSFDFSSLYSADSFYFNGSTAGDPAIDYSKFHNRMRVPFLEFAADMTGYGTAKQLALIFGFQALTMSGIGRVLVYTDAGLISNQ